MANGSHERNLAQSETLCTWRRSLSEPGRSHPCPEFCTGPAREGGSHTPSMYVDEKSDEAIVLMKRSNKGRQLPAEVGREGPHPRETADRRPWYGHRADCHVDPIVGCAPDPDGFNPHAAGDRPEGGARCVSSARRICAGGEEQSSSLPRPSGHRVSVQNICGALFSLIDRARRLTSAPGRALRRALFSRASIFACMAVSCARSAPTLKNTSFSPGASSLAASITEAG